jgi:hypothetical protein
MFSNLDIPGFVSTGPATLQEIGAFTICATLTIIHWFAQGKTVY